LEAVKGEGKAGEVKKSGATAKAEALKKEYDAMLAEAKELYAEEDSIRHAKGFAGRYERASKIADAEQARMVEKGNQLYASTPEGERRSVMNALADERGKAVREQLRGKYADILRLWEVQGKTSTTGVYRQRGLSGFDTNEHGTAREKWREYIAATREAELEQLRLEQSKKSEPSRPSIKPGNEPDATGKTVTAREVGEVQPVPTPAGSRTNAEVAKVAGKPTPKVKLAEHVKAEAPKPTGIESRLSDEGKAALARLRARKLRGATGNLPKGEGASEQLARDLKDVTVVGRDLVKAGVKDFDTWSRAIIEEAGDWVKEHLPKIWAQVGPKEAATEVQEVRVVDHDPIAIKNRVTDELAIKLGLTPPNKAQRKSQGAVYDQAMSMLKEDFGITDRLVDSLRDNPRPVFDYEDALLLHRMGEHKIEYNRWADEANTARNSGDSVAAMNANAKADAALADVYDLIHIVDAVGTQQARGLAYRRQMIDEDFTLLPLERRLSHAKGENISTKEREELQRIADDYKAKNSAYEKALTEKDAQIAEQVSRIKHLEMVRRTRQAKPKIPITTRTGIIDNLSREKQARLKAAEDRLFAKLTRLNVNVDVTAVADLAEIVGLYIEAGAKATSASIRALVRKNYPQLAGKLNNETIDAALLKALEGQREATAEQIKARVSEKVPVTELGNLIQQLARQHVEAGVKTREVLIDAVHADLKDIVPDMTRRQVMDAISGYGDFKQLSKDEISQQLRDLKGQMQQVGKLEDMQAGKAPKKTGVERRTASAEERRLIKLVEEAKRRGGYNVTDPATQLASALQARKTYYHNRLADLKAEIASRQRLIKNKTAPPTDAELQRLKAEYKTVKEEHDNIFTKPGLTDAQRLKLATEAARRNYTEWQKRLADAKQGQFPSGKRPRATSPELEAIRTRTEALREQVRELDALANPEKREQLAIRGYKTRLANQIAELQQKMAAGDFIQRTRRETPITEELLRMRAERDDIVQHFNRMVREAQMARKTTIERVQDAIPQTINLFRAIKTSPDISAPGRQGSFFVYSRPGQARNAFRRQLEAFKSKQGEAKAIAYIETHPLYALARQAKLAFTYNADTMAAREEAYMSELADYIPLVAGSSRAYNTFLNVQRMEVFAALVKSISRGGSVTTAEARMIADFVNAGTGRGDLRGFERSAVVLNTYFYSTRFLASRFQLALGYITAGQSFAKPGASVRLRLAFAKEYARNIVGMSVYAMLIAAATGGVVKAWPPTDPESGKLKIGNIRIDVTGGVATAVRFAIRMLEQAKGIFGYERPMTAYQAMYSIGSFGRSKASPVAGAAWTAITGEHYDRRKASIGTIAWELVEPMIARDLYESLKDQPNYKGAIASGLAILGQSSMVYEERSSGNTKRKLGKPGKVSARGGKVSP